LGSSFFSSGSIYISKLNFYFPVLFIAKIPPEGFEETELVNNPFGSSSFFSAGSSPSVRNNIKG